MKKYQLRIQMELLEMKSDHPFKGQQYRYIDMDLKWWEKREDFVKRMQQEFKLMLIELLNSAN